VSSGQHSLQIEPSRDLVRRDAKQPARNDALRLGLDNTPIEFLFRQAFNGPAESTYNRFPNQSADVQCGGFYVFSKKVA